MPEHNAQMLQFAAMMSGEYREAQRQAEKMVRFPEIYGPTNMSDGELTVG
jgi:hypothetical protein